MCEHLQALDLELRDKGIQETYRGQAWSDNCREWVYYNCVLDVDSLTRRFDFADCVKVHANDDPRSGTEKGFVCELCHDAVMGRHPLTPGDNVVIH
jgi:hypothetical protein